MRYSKGTVAGPVPTSIQIISITPYEPRAGHPDRTCECWEPAGIKGTAGQEPDRTATMHRRPESCNRCQVPREPSYCCVSRKNQHPRWQTCTTFNWFHKISRQTPDCTSLTLQSRAVHVGLRRHVALTSNQRNSVSGKGKRTASIKTTGRSMAIQEALNDSSDESEETMLRRRLAYDLRGGGS